VARLRIRIELSRGGVGVPLHKMASVISEAQRFLQAAAEDIGISRDKGEWLGFDFDRESLHFTAEYVGPVSINQVSAFYAAFDGTTSLRRTTIAQFARIADAIGEEEVIGFGLYQSDDLAEPSEWRCLSRRDALRIAEEIQSLLTVSGERDQPSHLPAVRDRTLGARIFGDRRERAGAEAPLAEYVKEVETTLSSRITRVESQMQQQAAQIQDLRAQSEAAEESFRNLLTTIEVFCGQATRQIEQLAAPAQAQAQPQAPPQPQTQTPPPQPQPFSPPPPSPSPAMASVGLPASFLETAGRSQDTSSKRLVLLGAAVVLTALAFLVSAWFRLPRSGSSSADDPSEVAAAPPVISPATPDPAPQESPGPKPPPSAEVPKAAPPVPSPAAPSAPEEAKGEASSAMRLEIEATEPAWIMVTTTEGTIVMNRLLEPGSRRTIELKGPATLRTGNAAATSITLNGKPIGSVGGVGAVRNVRFEDGKFRFLDAQ
jgi:hypothetical protein